MASLGIKDFLHATRHPLMELFLGIYSDTPPGHTSSCRGRALSFFKHIIFYYFSIFDREGQEVPGIINDKKVTKKNDYFDVIKYSKGIGSKIDKKTKLDDSKFLKSNDFVLLIITC